MMMMDLPADNWHILNVDIHTLYATVYDQPDYEYNDHVRYLVYHLYGCSVGQQRHHHLDMTVLACYVQCREFILIK